MSQNNDHDTQPPPNLANILATLSTFTQQAQAPSEQQAGTNYAGSIDPHGSLTGSLQGQQSHTAAYGYGYTGYASAPEQFQQYAQQVTPRPQPQPTERSYTPPIAIEDDQDDYEPPEPLRQSPPVQSQPAPSAESVRLPPKPRQQSAVKTQDPATIVTWSAAIRHVTRLAARHEELGQRIAKVGGSDWHAGHLKLGVISTDTNVHADDQDATPARSPMVC